MKSILKSYNIDVDCAYIIRIKNNEQSERLAFEAAESCVLVGMPYEFWDAYDGLQNPIKESIHHGQFMKMVKLTNHFLTRGEVACALSHISLWVKCVEEDKPIVILEHDALMIKPYRKHQILNSICYLGGIEQSKQKWPVLPYPPNGSEGHNVRFICRAHAYAIDPDVAKNMLAMILHQGIYFSLDVMLRSDLFALHQLDLYATDRGNSSNLDNTTILNRDYGKMYRNDGLLY